jgi:hypothetical protein
MLAAAILLAGTTAGSAEYRAWTGEFMRMGAGARAFGMGNAYTAVEGDVYSSYFNPAGLGIMTDREFTYSYRHLTMDRQFGYAAFGMPIGPDAGFAVSWLNAGTDDIQGRDLNGHPVGDIRDDRNAFTISFAKVLNKWVSVGINTKLALWKLADEDARSFGFDLGVNIRPLPYLTLGATARDLNSRFTWQSDRWSDYITGSDGQSLEKEDDFPAYYTVGAAVRTFKDALVLSGAIELVQDNPMGLDFGASYEVNDRFTVRTGFYNFTSDDDFDQGSYAAGITLGVTRSMSVDYTYATDSYNDDSIHQFALHMGYGD